MVGLGFGLAWIAYTGMIWGVSLLKGWDLSLGEIASIGHPYSGTWPPPIAPNTVVFPTGQAATKTTAVSKTTGGKPGTVTPGGGGTAGPPEVAV